VELKAKVEKKAKLKGVKLGNVQGVVKRLVGA